MESGCTDASTSQKLRLASARVMESLHRAQLPVYGVGHLSQHRAHRRHLGVFEHRVPACLFGLEPVAQALA